MLLPLLSRAKDLLDDMEIDGFSWAEFQSGTVGVSHLGLHQAFWTALFNENPVRLFYGKRSVRQHSLVACLVP